MHRETRASTGKHREAQRSTSLSQAYVKARLGGPREAKTIASKSKKHQSKHLPRPRFNPVRWGVVLGGLGVVLGWSRPYPATA